MNTISHPRGRESEYFVCMHGRIPCADPATLQTMMNLTRDLRNAGLAKITFWDFRSARAVCNSTCFIPRGGVDTYLDITSLAVHEQSSDNSQINCGCYGSQVADCSFDWQNRKYSSRVMAFEVLQFRQLLLRVMQPGMLRLVSRR